MTEHDQSGFSFAEDTAVDFNPLEAFAFDDAENDEDALPSVLAEGPFNMPDPEAIPQFQRELVAFDNGETAQMRIEALFAQMPTLHKMLFAILDRCSAPIPTADLETAIEEMKRHHHSVYEPLTLCSLLERAGAIAQTDADGVPLTEAEQEPLRVEIDGVEFWHVAPVPAVYWSLTEEGAAQLDTYRPMEMIARCYEAEPQYADIFTTCLKLCSRDGGTSLRAIGDIVDDEPVLQSPKRYAMYFIDKLEHAGAVEWTGQWSLTAHGREYLTTLNED